PRGRHRPERPSRRRSGHSSWPAVRRGSSPHPRGAWGSWRAVPRRAPPPRRPRRSRTPVLRPLPVLLACGPLVAPTPPTSRPTAGSVAPMETITVQGEQVPTVGFGTWALSGDAAREGVRHALELGYRQIDTAQAYENEREVGEGIADSGVPREDSCLTTKIRGENLAGERVRPPVDASLRRLATG